MDGRPLTFELLVQFHREVVLGDIERIVDARLDSRLTPISHRLDDFLSHFDAIFGRLDRLDSEMQAMNAGLHRLEVRVTSIEV